jgi:hypothetical protein
MTGFRVHALLAVTAALLLAVLSPPWPARGLPGDPPVMALSPPANLVGIAGPDQVQDPDLGADQCRGWLAASSSRSWRGVGAATARPWGRS